MTEPTSDGKMERAISKHIAGVKRADLSPAVTMSARRELVWCIGTAIAGANAPGSEEIRDFATESSGHPQATILGFGDQAPAHMAGLANATYAKAHEYEDKIWIGNTHGYGVGMAVVPAALAVAERKGGVSGDELLTAIAVATDVHARLLAAPIDATFGKSGWNSAYLFSVFGATAAAAKIMGLDESATQNAMGLAYAQAAGNYQGQIEGVLGVRLQLGFAVRNGIMAADLAGRGITGIKQFLTGRYALYPLYFGDREVDLESVTEGLGTKFRGERLGFKGYPCGLVAHPAMDALRTLAGSYAPEDVVAVRVFGDEHMRIMTDPRDVRKNPRNFIDAQFSIPWAIACVIVDGTVKLQHYEAPALADPRYRTLAQLVDVRLEGDRGSSCVELELRGGRTLRSIDVKVAHGHPDNPRSNAEIAEVFRDCLAFGPKNKARAQAARLPEMVLDGDSIPDTDALMELLRPA
ncbi:MAG: MmgE/PrpD family protein [Candidatus Acidiferrales bacterium]